MTTTEAPTKPAKAGKPATQGAPVVRGPDDAVHIRELKFKGSVDLGLEQQVARINSHTGSSNARYDIHYLPRIDKYRVREWKASQTKDEPPFNTVLVPGDWCIAIVDVATEPGSAKLGA